MRARIQPPDKAAMTFAGKQAAHHRIMAWHNQRDILCQRGNFIKAFQHLFDIHHNRERFAGHKILIIMGGI